MKPEALQQGINYTFTERQLVDTRGSDKDANPIVANYVAHPALFNVVSDVSNLVTAIYGETASFPEWARKIQTAKEGSVRRPSDNDRWIRRAASGFAQYAMEANKKGTNPDLERLYSRAYEGLNIRLRRGNIKATPEFTATLYTEVMPIILNCNQVSERYLNQASHNSIGQIVSTATAIAEAQQKSLQGGELVILSPTCAHYDSGTDNEESSYDLGLLQAVYRPKAEQVLNPMRQIAEAVNKQDVPVTVLIPQVDPLQDSRLMLAMVPAAMWKYISDGEVAEMLLHNNNLTRQFDLVAQEMLNDNAHPAPTEYIASTLADFSTDGKTTTHDLVDGFNLQFEQAYDTYVNNSDREEVHGSKNWTDLTSADVRRMVDTMNDTGAYSEIIKKCTEKYGWTQRQEEAFRLMFDSLSVPGWGGLDDTARFYERESERRAKTQGDEWKRVFDIDTEREKLLANSQFYSDLSTEERTQKADDIIKAVVMLANIGIGGRAIYNTTVYFAYGCQMGEIAASHHTTIMWPIQGATDRQALDSMDRGYKFTSGINTSVAPIICPEKDKIQPLGRRGYHE